MKRLRQQEKCRLSEKQKDNETKKILWSDKMYRSKEKQRNREMMKQLRLKEKHKDKEAKKKLKLMKSTE